MSHLLRINLKCVLAKQTRRMLDPGKASTMKEEVGMLRGNGFIWCATHPAWISNPVLVKNANGKWRTCIDFLDLNKVRPKGSFPSIRIDSLWIQWLDMNVSLSWTCAQLTTKFLCMCLIMNKHVLSLTSNCTVIWNWHSDRRMPRQLTSAYWIIWSTTKVQGPWKSM